MSPTLAQVADEGHASWVHGKHHGGEGALGSLIPEGVSLHWQSEESST